MSSSIQTIQSGLQPGCRIGIDSKGFLSAKKIQTSRYCFLTKAARGETRKEREALSIFKTFLKTEISAATSDQLIEMGKSLKARRLQVDKRLNGAFAFIKALFRIIFMGCAEHRELKRLHEELKQVERILNCTEKGFLAKLNTHPTNTRERDFIKSNFSEFICSGTPSTAQFTEGKRVLLEPWGFFYKLHMLTPSGAIRSKPTCNLADIGHAYGELLAESKRNVFEGLRRRPNYLLEDNQSYVFANSLAESSISKSHLCDPFSASKALDKVIIEFCSQTHNDSGLVNNVRDQYEGYAAVKLHYFDSKENLPKTKLFEISQYTNSEQLRQQIADFARENKAACNEECKQIKKFAEETLGCSIGSSSKSKKWSLVSNDSEGTLSLGIHLNGKTYWLKTPGMSLKAVKTLYKQLLRFEENERYVESIKKTAKAKGITIELKENLRYELSFKNKFVQSNEWVVSYQNFIEFMDLNEGIVFERNSLKFNFNRFMGLNNLKIELTDNLEYKLSFEDEFAGLQEVVVPYQNFIEFMDLDERVGGGVVLNQTENSITFKFLETGLTKETALQIVLQHEGSIKFKFTDLHKVVVPYWDENSVETHYKAIELYLKNEEKTRFNTQALSTVKAIGLPSLTALDALPNVQLDSLLTLFDAINFNDPTKPGYCDPLSLKRDGGYSTTKDKLRKNLEKLLNNIRLTQSYEGIPKEEPKRKRFYEELTAVLTHVIKHMQSQTDPDLVTPHLINLAVGAGECGKRWKSDAFEVYAFQHNLSIDIGENTPISDLVRHWFEEIKSEIVKELVNERLHGTGQLPGQTPHIENYYLKVLQLANIRCTLSAGLDEQDPCEEMGKNANYGQGDAVCKAFLRKLSTLPARMHAKFKENWNQKSADLIKILREHAECHLTESQATLLAKELEKVNSSLKDWRDPKEAANLVGPKRELLKIQGVKQPRCINQLTDEQIIENEIKRLRTLYFETKNEYLDKVLTDQGLVIYDEHILCGIDDITLEGVNTILQYGKIVEAI